LKKYLFIVFILIMFIFSSCRGETDPPASDDKMIIVPAGTFEMGSSGGKEDEKSVHKVELSSFYMSRFEVTNSEYCKFLNDCGNHTEGETHWIIMMKESSRYCAIIEEKPGKFRVNEGFENLPALGVTWYGAVAYCNWLSEKEGLKPCYGPEGERGDDPSLWLKSAGYRLPTEAEWEYACRGGTETDYYWGNEVNDEYLWYRDNSDKIAHNVGEKKPNAFGLFDMSGNAFEWCNDFYGPYEDKPLINPSGPASGECRVKRGGDWSLPAEKSKSFVRSKSPPERTGLNGGFRSNFLVVYTIIVII